MFYGRREELEALDGLWGKAASSFVVCSGRRRVGKSTLVEEFAARSKCRFIEITGLAPDEGVTNETQLRHFCERLAAQTGRPEARADGWAKAFDALAAAIRGRGRTVVFLDEISWMGAFDKTFPALLKEAWDTRFARRDNLVFVVCGSVSAWLRDNILRSRAFVGRVSLALHLEEMPLRDCLSFWGAAAGRTSVRDVVDALCVTGGIPKYLAEWRPVLPAAENIRRLCFTPEGYLFRDFDVIFTDVFRRTSGEKASILRLVADAPRSAKDIASALGLAANGHVSDSLADLVEAGFLSADSGVNPATGRNVREVRYRVRDNYARFYLKFVEPRRKAVADGSLRLLSPARLPGWDTVMGLQFETLVRNNLRTLLPLVGMDGALLVSAAPYAVRGTKRGEGAQIDLLLQTAKSVCLVEIRRQKFVPGSFEDDMRRKIAVLRLPRSLSVRTALVYDGDAAPELAENRYIDFLVPVERLFGL
jgi:hypothetical protein